MKKAICISDLHGKLDIEIPEADILFIAGDIVPAGRIVEIDSNWLQDKFNPWLKSLPVKYIIFTPGNHDEIFQNAPRLVPKLSLSYLVDQQIEIDGIKIYGSPWQPIYRNWAFNINKEARKYVWSKIPEDTQILLLHCPPFGTLDKVYRRNPNFQKHIGCKPLKNRIKELPNLKYVIFGHAHESHGLLEKDGITYINCSVLNDKCKMVYKPIILNIEI